VRTIAAHCDGGVFRGRHPTVLSTVAARCGQRFRITAKIRLPGHLYGKPGRIRPQAIGNPQRCGQMRPKIPHNRQNSSLGAFIRKTWPHSAASNRQSSALRLSPLMRRRQPMMREASPRLCWPHQAERRVITGRVVDRAPPPPSASPWRARRVSRSRPLWKTHPPPRR
jgi:hypothetical protein